ncbi:Lipase 3-like 2 [Homarus americanus]|uniref:Lipase 3-like 2 n=1 Tax=Homarus americanus TaxID=6706 RepID=A0A8J5KEW3_HOMAM|nr:Lipase 3-like 2 [Homarus americanus]
MVMVVVMVWETRGQVNEVNSVGVRGSFITPTARWLLGIFQKYDGRSNESTPDLIRSSGYPAETHHVTTEDGYILELHRIPCGVQCVLTEEHRPRPVALLHHSYMMADAGYDVWLTNARGNTYSRNHVHLSPEDKEFWQFSWNEMAMYDVPAVIDYVLNVTRQEDLYYVGFSMGTTVFWAMMSERPEYANKIRFMVALGPVAHVQHIAGPLGYLAPFVSQIEITMNLLGKYELLSFGPVIDRLISTFCNEQLFTSAICQNILFLIWKFQKYDFGTLGNLRQYGSLSPPSYNLSRVTVPVALFWSDNDWLADPTDVLHLVGQLPHVVYSHRVEDSKFTHLDFVWALHADKLVYHDLLRVLAQY